MLLCQINFTKAIGNQFCPMPIGKLGSTLNLNITLDSCTFDNTTSNPSQSSSCSTWIRFNLRRGEHEELGADEMTVKLYGGELCFAYKMKSTTTGPGAGASENCVNKCFDVSTTNTPWLIEDIYMRCTEESGRRSCLGTVKYIKVTLNKGAFPRRVETEYCTMPQQVKDGDKESVQLKVQDCLKVTSQSGKNAERCDDASAMKMKEIRAGKTNASQKLVISKFERETSLRFLAVNQEVFGYFKGDNFCVNVGPIERNITASDVHYNKSRICNEACTSYKGGAPAEVTYYKESIKMNQSQTLTVKTLKFFASTGVVHAPSFDLFMMWIPVLVIAKLM